MTIRNTRQLGDAALLPSLEPLNREWFTRGAITIQKCLDCESLQHPPDETCPSCQGANLGWQECGGGGRIESVAVVHQAVHPSFAESVPYAVVVVSLDDAPGVNVIGNVVDCDPADVAIGQRVRAAFEQIPATDDRERLLVPVWERV